MADDSGRCDDGAPFPSEYTFVPAIGGNDVATNLKGILSSNSLVGMPHPIYETWFMEGTLIPDYHYVEIRPDYSDLEERMRYYIAYPDEAGAIIAHAHACVERFRDRRRERLVATRTGALFRGDGPAARDDAAGCRAADDIGFFYVPIGYSNGFSGYFAEKRRIFADTNTTTQKHSDYVESEAP